MSSFAAPLRFVAFVNGREAIHACTLNTLGIKITFLTGQRWLRKPWETFEGWLCSVASPVVERPKAAIICKLYLAL